MSLTENAGSLQHDGFLPRISLLGKGVSGDESVTFSFPYGVSFQHRGDLGNIQAEAGGRATFRIEDKQLKVR